MDATISRRDFIKTTSATAAGATLMSFAPWASGMDKKRAKSLVVIAKDTTCATQAGSTITVDSAKVQDMVDHAIMTLTGQTEKAKAYEALFPGITTSKKILVKYNNSRTTASKSQAVVRNALKNGLTSMISSTFPASNITEVGAATGANTTEKVSIGGTDYFIRDIWANCDYFINLPSCWAMSISPQNCGMTMSLKGMMPAVNRTGGLGGFHSHFTDDAGPSLSILNSHTIFKQKQMLVLMDAICVSPAGGTAVKLAHSIVATKDMVANDYQGIQILDAATGFVASNKTAAEKVVELAAKPDYGLGTNDPNNMDVVRISPPWNTEIITNGNTNVNPRDIQVMTQSAYTVFNYPGTRASVEIFDIKGRKIWTYKSSEKSIVWQNSDLSGGKVPSGIYLYQLKIENVVARGEIAVK